MIAKCLAFLCVTLLVIIVQDVNIKSLLLSFFFLKIQWNNEFVIQLHFFSFDL